MVAPLVGGGAIGDAGQGEVAAAAAGIVIEVAAPVGARLRAMVPGHGEGAGWTGIASWYGPGFAGRTTANGEIFDPGEMTAAHRTLELGTRVRVTSLESGRSVEVRINDRGPYIDGREIDLSRAAADHLGMIEAGLGEVLIEEL